MEKPITNTRMCVFLLESFIEVSEEEFTQQDVEPTTEERETPDDVQEVDRKAEDSLGEAPASLVVREQEDKKSQTEDEGLKEGAEMGGSSSPAVNQWEQFDAVSMEVKVKNALKNTKYGVSSCHSFGVKTFKLSVSVFYLCLVCG